MIIRRPASVRRLERGDITRRKEVTVIVTNNFDQTNLEEQMSKLTEAVDALQSEVVAQGEAVSTGLARIKDDFAVLTTKLEAALADDEDASRAADRINESITALQNQREEFSAVDPDPTNPPTPVEEPPVAGGGGNFG